MNFEALLVIGIFTILVGGILLIPLFIWKKWKGEKAFPTSGALAIKVSSRGIRYYGIFVVFLFIGFAQEFITPQSGFGQFISSWFGKIMYLICLIVVSAIIEYVLVQFGIKLTEPSDDDE
jgi:hypothetical protein